MSDPNPSGFSKLRFALLGAGALVVLGVVLFAPQLAGLAGKRDGGDEARAQNATDHGAIAVRVIEMRAAPSPRSSASLRATGTLEAHRHVPLAFVVSGVVRTLVRDEGDAVAAGEVLGRLDPIPFESAVDQAAARVSFLEKSLERSRKLLDQKALSPEEFDAQESELVAARAQLELAQWNLERSVLRAPFAGRVLRRSVEIGQVVGPSAIAFELIDLQTLDLRAALPASDLGLVDLDAPVTVLSSDDPSLRATGRIDHAPVSSDARSGSVPLLVQVDNEDARLLPGSVVEASFGAKRSGPAPVGSSKRELRIPLSALRLDDAGQAAWRVTDGHAQRVEVELGTVRGDEVVVLAGLDPGDLVIDEIPDQLRDGDAVTIVARQEVDR